jgi:A-factor type gamma-butyrolactone 1'-reductase (1S-forming)
VDALIDETLRVFGRVDCAVNNAGITGPVMTPIADVEDDQWDDLMNTNLRAVFLCMKSEILVMLQNGSGSIVNMASIYGCIGSDVGHAPYAASKHAVIGLTKSAAINYADRGIR